MPTLRHAVVALAVAGVASTLAATVPAQQARPQGPCDIYAAAGTPCVTAHSTVRSLSSRYGGPLYQVKRADGQRLDIGVIAGGVADAAAQDGFCASALCYINRIYDQSGKGNDLMQAPPGPLYPGPDTGAFDTQPIADMAPITIGGGHKAYGVYIMPGMGFRNNNARDLPVGDEPAGIHAVVDGEHYSNGCCFNYGNASTNGLAVGTGTMESVYFGTSTGWGSGSGTGPWIMSDMEAGLFSGYNARVNDADPTITWRFVTGVFGGGGRNFWELRGGNAQQGGLQTFYAGVRPGSKENNAYFPMRKKGAIQMGNGGDNGNGSAGTFYEGVMTAGHPGDGVADEVQANIVTAKYDVARLTQTRLTSFPPAAVKEVTATFANTSAASMNDVRLTVSLPAGWTARASGPATLGSVAPGATVRATFQITAPARASMGVLTLRAAWTGGTDVSQQRVRSVLPVTLNEVRFASGGNATDQFIELYNASASPVDISGWRLINTRTWSAPVTLTVIPAGTMMGPRSHYLLGLANSGLAGQAAAGATAVHLRSTAGLSPGAEVDVNGERRTVKTVGTAATAPTRVFIAVSTGPWLDFPAGTTNLPVHSAEGFTVGEKIGIDRGGSVEIATVTSVGKAATQTTLAASATPGATQIKLTALADVSAGDTLTIDTGQRIERAVVASVGTAGADGTGITLTAPLQLAHNSGVDVWGRGTGISFTPATRFAHRSGDAVQALGSGVVLDRPLARAHAYGAPVRYSGVTSEGYQGPAPNAWFGSTLFITGGAIALTDASGAVVMDAIVYGSQQSNSSANGYITRPDLATLEGVQHQGGCIAVVPGAGSGPATATIAAAAAAPGAPNRSLGRFPDGHDTDSLCTDFLVQPATTVPEGAAAGATNIKVAGVAGFAPAQTVVIGAGPASERAVIASVGTAGSTRAGAATQVGDAVIPVVATAGFVVGQSITIDSGADQETATIALVQGGRGGARLTVTAPLKIAHPSGAPLAGSGITLTAPLVRVHPGGAAVTTDLPTPGAANNYFRPRPTPPTRPGLRLVQASELPDGTLPRPRQDGNFIVGPTHAPAPETRPREDVPKGAVHAFTLTSAESSVYPDGLARDPGTFGTPDPANPAKLVVSTSRPAPWTRQVSVFVPAQYVPGTVVPFIVGADGPDPLLFTTLENLIAERRLPVMIGIAVGNGGGDAQGSQRGREYDTLSARYAEFIENDVLPQVERRFSVRLATDPDQRAAMGCSSGAAAALGMAWYRTDRYHRVLSYSGTFVNQQWPWNPETPQGAWGYHTTLIPNAPRKPLRIWMQVGDRDLYNPNVMRDDMHDWVDANERMAQALAAKAYPYQFTFVRNAVHCDRAVKAQTLPAALEYVWAR